MCAYYILFTTYDIIYISDIIFNSEYKLYCMLVGNVTYIVLYLKFHLAA